MAKKDKELHKKLKKLRYITYEEMHRKSMRNKKFRAAWEAGEAEHAIRAAIIAKRIQKKLTQAQVAKRAGMHQSAIARFEADEDGAALTTASRLLAAVGAKIKIS